MVYSMGGEIISAGKVAMVWRWLYNSEFGLLNRLLRRSQQGTAIFFHYAAAAISDNVLCGGNQNYCSAASIRFPRVWRTEAFKSVVAKMNFFRLYWNTCLHLKN